MLLLALSTLLRLVGTCSTPLEQSDRASDLSSTQLELELVFCQLGVERTQPSSQLSLRTRSSHTVDSRAKSNGLFSSTSGPHQQVSLLAALHSAPEASQFIRNGLVRMRMRMEMEIVIGIGIGIGMEIDIEIESGNTAPNSSQQTHSALSIHCSRPRNR